MSDLTERYVKTTYSREGMGTYVYINQDKKVESTVPFYPENNRLGYMVNLDLAQDGTLVGVECLFVKQ